MVLWFDHDVMCKPDCEIGHYDTKYIKNRGRLRQVNRMSSQCGLMHMTSGTMLPSAGLVCDLIHNDVSDIIFKDFRFRVPLRLISNAFSAFLTIMLTLILISLKFQNSQLSITSDETFSLKHLSYIYL